MRAANALCICVKGIGSSLRSAAGRIVVFLYNSLPHFPFSAAANWPFLVATVHRCNDEQARRSPSLSPSFVKVRENQLFLSALCLVIVAGVWQESCVFPLRALLANWKRGPTLILILNGSLALRTCTWRRRWGQLHMEKAISSNNYSDNLAPAHSTIQHSHLELFCVSKAYGFSITSVIKSFNALWNQQITW